MYADAIGAKTKFYEWLSSCDAVLIGAGAGFSASAGFDYAGKRFTDHFGDFAQKYRFGDMYTGGFYPFPSAEEFWAYWSRYIYLNRYCDPPKPVYRDLMRLVGNKDYFVLTTNVDHCFQKAGVEKERLFYTQGDYGLFQCSVPCHDKTYDNEEVVLRLVRSQKGMRVAEELIPRCPVCGKPMTVNLRADDTFVQDEGWHAAMARYSAFLAAHKSAKLLFLELGVGGNTPAIIKYPFWKMTAQNPDARYVCVNQNEAYCPREIENRSLCFQTDIGDFLVQGE